MGIAYVVVGLALMAGALIRVMNKADEGHNQNILAQGSGMQEFPNHSQYLAALADVRYFNQSAQPMLDQARAAGYGQGQMVGVEKRFVDAYVLVAAWENRNWFSRHFGAKTQMVELV
jgi:hypothetical protein